MPLEITGVVNTLKNIKKFEPELLKEMNKDIRNAMVPIRDKARGYVPSSGTMLSGWVRPIVSEDVNYRPFPKYDESLIKDGIVYRQGKNDKKPNGFRAVYYVANNNGAGAIYETAGRVHPGGRKQAPKVYSYTQKKMIYNSDREFSQSNNPDAGEQFISSVGGQNNMTGQGKERGRLIFRAWYEDHGKAYNAVINAINTTVKDFNQFKSVFRQAA
jgi:hypothetical protein